MSPNNTGTINLKDRRRQVIVQSMGLLIALLALSRIVATLLNWTTPFASFHLIGGWPIDLVGLAALSGGYHMFCLREFGRRVIVLLTWMYSALMIAIGGLALSQPALSAIRVRVLHVHAEIDGRLGVSGIIGAVLLAAITITIFLFQPATKAIFRR